MATIGPVKYVFFTGKAKWCRPVVPDPWGAYKTNVYPNAESLELFRELQTADGKTQGVKNTLKKDDDGYFFVIRRDVQKQMRGKIISLGPVEVLDGNTPLKDADGNIKGYMPLHDVHIGNGSDCVFKCELRVFNVPGVAEGTKGRSLRWASVRVDNLVPFSRVEDFTEGEAKLAKGLELQPQQIW